MSTSKKTNSHAMRKDNQNIVAIIAGYKRMDDGNPLTQRIAHFLNWASSNARRIYFQHNFICKAVHGYSHTPRPKTDEVNLIRKAMTSVKKVLRIKYGKGFDYQRGLGVRACVDDNDTVNHNLIAANKRFIGAKIGVDNVAAIVDQKKLGPKEAAYYKETVAASKLISSDRIQKLLPPKPKV